MRPLRLALIADSLEEEWKSMDVCAEALFEALQSEMSERVQPVLIRLPFPRVARSVSTRRSARFVDRVLCRYAAYPLRVSRGFDAYHVVDHSYAHLVSWLPRGRSGVYVHDLDAFASLDEPWRARSVARRVFAQAAAHGLRRARVAFFSTDQVGAPGRARFGGRWVKAPLGVQAAYEAAGPAHDAGHPYVLHVGSDLARRRVDVLLRAFAEARRQRPELRLFQRGAEPSCTHAALVAELGIRDALVELPRLTDLELATYYRGASVTVLSSDHEGFGLPLIEALACGSPVVCTDIAAFREVGGTVVERVPAGDSFALAAAIVRNLDVRDEVSERRRREHAARFSWREHADTIATTYEQLFSTGAAA